MRRVLIQFAHPVLERSRVNRHLIEAVQALDGVTVNDLYEVYPDLSIDVKREQALLDDHDVIVFQHPFYWYTGPAILKEWQDLVLEHGWAYGQGGEHLEGKLTFNAISAGAPKTAYRTDGYNRFTIRQLLAPWHQTAHLCGMHYLGPFVVFGALQIAEHNDMHVSADAYRTLIEALRDDRIDLERAIASEDLQEELPQLLTKGGRMTDDILAQALTYLVAAVVFVPLSKRLGLGAVLGYLIGGVVIGPWVLGFVGGEGHHVMRFAEFGVVMMLFVVGLELRPALLWQLRRSIFGTGGMQVVLTTAVVAGIAIALGIAWKTALAIGMTFAMSSTAIVLASLTEMNLLKTAGGQAAFSVLLFQDISVIPILAVFPLLGAAADIEEVTNVTSEAGRPGWLSALFVIGAVLLVIVIGRFLVRPLFRFLAGAQLRESFTAAALLIVVGIAFLMESVGLSPALGTFLAGVVLADSEYRHELETDIEPFKGLLLGLFFISVGAQIDFGLVASQPLQIAAIVLGAMVGKLIIMHVIGRMFGLDRPARWLLAISLAQVGEFAFVLLSFAVQERIFDANLASMMTACVAISMVLTPPAFILLERFVLPRVTDDEADKRPQDEIEFADTPVVVAGYGRFGQMVGRILRANGIPLTILDLDPEMVDVLGRLDIKVYYGDASRVDLLHAAGCATAKLFVLAVDDKDAATEIARAVRENFPNLEILARCRDRPHYWELRSLGVKKVFRETFGSAYETGICALQSLGYRAHTALRLARKWRDHEESVLEELGEVWGSGDRDSYFARTRNAMAEAEKLMRAEDPRVFVARDAGWDNESLRADPVVDEAAAADKEPIQRS